MTTLYTLMTMDELLTAGETEGGLAAVIASRAAAELVVARDAVRDAERDAEALSDELDEASRNAADADDDIGEALDKLREALTLLERVDVDASPEAVASLITDAINKLEG